MIRLSEQRADILEAITIERKRQDTKFGVQNWPIHPIGFRQKYESYSRSADEIKNVNASNVRAGTTNWGDTLIEEVYEALAEHDPDKCKQELIQVAAVCVAMIECLDRNKT